MNLQINIIRMVRQFEYFQEYQNRVTALIGAQQTKQLVNRALILITVGGNDFVNNYYLVPYSARSLQYSLPDYVKFVISEYKKLLKVCLISTILQHFFGSLKNAYFRISLRTNILREIILQRLYDLGARRVLVTGSGPLGCVPAELAQRSRNGQCSAELQRAASLFNPQLDQILRQLNSQVGSDVFVGVNTQLMHNDFISNPQAYGALPFNDLVLDAIFYFFVYI